MITCTNIKAKYTSITTLCSEARSELHANNPIINYNFWRIIMCLENNYVFAANFMLYGSILIENTL